MKIAYKFSRVTWVFPIANGSWLTLFLTLLQWYNIIKSPFLPPFFGLDSSL